MRFAQQGVILAGQLPAPQLARLGAAVSEVLDGVEASLRFSIDDNGLRLMTGTVSAQVRVPCQRCLADMTIVLSTELSLALVYSDADAKLLPKQIDPWLLSADQSDIDLYEVLEEELLLCLPIVAHHSHQCVDKQLYSSGEAVQKSDNNPFQILEKLNVSKP